MDDSSTPNEVGFRRVFYHYLRTSNENLESKMILKQSSKYFHYNDSIVLCDITKKPRLRTLTSFMPLPQKKKKEIRFCTNNVPEDSLIIYGNLHINGIDIHPLISKILYSRIEKATVCNQNLSSNEFEKLGNAIRTMDFHNVAVYEMNGRKL